MSTHLVPLLPYKEKKVGETGMSVSAPDAIITNVNIIRIWIDRCAQLHGGHCGGSRTSQMQSPFPSHITDVKRGCFVGAPERPYYVALSYVWGEAEA
jgi:hypothetical protein